MKIYLLNRILPNAKIIPAHCLNKVNLLAFYKCQFKRNKFTKFI